MRASANAAAVCHAGLEPRTSRPQPHRARTPDQQTPGRSATHTRDSCFGQERLTAAMPVTAAAMEPEP